jgi:hypothetical protein
MNAAKAIASSLSENFGHVGSEASRSRHVWYSFARAEIGRATTEQANAGDPWGCVVVGSILFNVLSICGVPLPGRLILVVLPENVHRRVLVIWMP